MPTLTQTPGSAYPQVNITDQDGVIDLTAAEQSEATVADTVAGEAAADPVTAPLVLETYLAYRGDQFLVNYPPWRNFWMGVGNSISGWLSNAGAAIFGTPQDTVTHDELRLSSNLAAHIAMAASRQLFGSVNGRLRVTTTRLVKAVNAIGAHVRANRAEAVGLAHHAALMAQAAQINATNYANARAHQVGVESEAYTDAHVAALQEWTITHIAQPLQSQVDTHTVQLQQQRQLIHDNGVRIDELAGTVGAAVALLHQMEPQLAKVLTETEQCTEPMCEYVGPKSDWGKLLSKFGPAALWAILVEIAATHPEVVEQLSEDLGRVLGPVLEKFAEAWIGVLPGGTGTEVSEVQSHVGSFNPLGISGL